MEYVQQLAGATEPQLPLHYPATSDGGVWDRLQRVVDQYGEFGDIEVDKGVVRKASFAYPRQLGLLRIHEVPNPMNLDGDLAYHVLRVDHRGEAEALVSREGAIGKQAIDAIHWDLDLYANSDHAELQKKRVSSAASWLIQPLLLLNTMRPSLKRNRTFDQSQQYKEKPQVTRMPVRQPQRVPNKEPHTDRGQQLIPVGGGSFRRQGRRRMSKPMRAMLLQMGVSQSEIRYVFEPHKRRK